jgi:hypothetical protein
MTGPSGKVAGAELTSAIVAVLGLLVAGGSRFVGWLIHGTKNKTELAEHRRDVMERFDRFERWCARVDAFMASYTEHRIADERFMARTDVALNSLAQRIGRVERVQDHAA